MNLYRAGSSPVLLQLSGINRLLGRLSHNAVAVSEYTEVPEYPPIVDNSKEAKRQRTKEEWHNEITSLPTIQQKLMEMNMPKYYGYWSCQMHSSRHYLNALEYIQYATRTHVSNDLPEEYYAEEKIEAAKILPRIRDQVEGLIDIRFSNGEYNEIYGDQHSKTRVFLAELHRIIISSVSANNEQLSSSIISMKFCLMAANFPVYVRVKGLKSEDDIKTMMDIEMYVVEDVVKPCINVHVANGLPEVVSLDHSIVTSGEVPVANLDPRAYGYKFKHNHATITPGLWPGANKEANQISYYSMESINRAVDKYGEDFRHVAVTQLAVLSSFTQGLAHAMHLGFGPLTELTYPLVQQLAMTDGQRWNFGAYQLNTCALHSDRPTNNNYNNVLWLSEEQKLFEAVEPGGIKGLNEDILISLISLYIKKGIQRENATPYLADYKHVGNFPSAEEYRQEFNEYLKILMSNRPRHKEKPEMYLWEKLYKSDFPTRPYEPPKRFFQNHVLKENRANHPGMRRLDEYEAIYVPKALQKHPKIKKKPRINSKHLFVYD
ncbi:unnamed protein product, partial [Meganyctiphanes norvegica]